MHILTIIELVLLGILVASFLSWEFLPAVFELAAIVAAIASGVAILVVSTLLAVMAVDGNACRIQAEGIGVQYDYSIIADCRIEVDGNLVPIDLVRIVENGQIIVPLEES